MNSIIRICLVMLMTVFLTMNDAHARGGFGGGGGRGGGGMSRPSPSVGRSPSMSRPAAAPSRPTGAPSRPSTPSVSRPSGVPSRSPAANTGSRPGTSAGSRTGSGAMTRPSAGQLNNFLDVKPSGGAGRPSTLPAGRTGNVAGGGAAADFLQGGGARPGTLPSTGNLPGLGNSQRPGIGQTPSTGRLPGAGERTGVRDRATVSDRSLTDNRAGRIENRGEWQDNRFERRDEIRDQVHDNHPRLDFWSEYPGWATWRINRPYRWATWGALTGWVGNGWTESVPYSYGENVYYEGDTVYNNGEVVASSEEYAEQAEVIAESAPEISPEEAEWMPLGVFALTQDGEASGPDPTLFLQLAISKEGIITGTLHNTATDSTQTIEGMADPKSQRCAWNVVDKARPIMETGIVNLTEDTAPALIHFEDGQTQQWLMVRLEEPEAQQQ